MSTAPETRPGVPILADIPNASTPSSGLTPSARRPSSTYSAGRPQVLRAKSRPPPTLKTGEKHLDGVEASKRLAAYAAVDGHVTEDSKVIGIGSGSTVPYVVDRIVQQGPEWNANRWFVPTGFQSKELIVQAGLKLGDVDQFPSIDVTIDGADEVDDALNCIKGGGGCHLREKVIAEAAKVFVLVADSRKNSHILGQKWKQGVPIEITPFAWAMVFRKLEEMGGKADLRMGAQAKAGPVVTDNGNFIVDAVFSEETMKDPKSLLHNIKLMTGVLEVGLFPGMAKACYFGNPDGSVTIRNADGSSELLTKDDHEGA